MSEVSRCLSLQGFEDRFPDDEACAEHLFRIRFPGGFVCPTCGSSRATRLKRPRCMHECRDCKRQTSATAGTFRHRSHVPLKGRFRAILLATGHSNGISAPAAQGPDRRRLQGVLISFLS